MSKSYKNKIRILLPLILIVASLAGCKKDFLNRKPLGYYTSDNYPYPEGAGVYDQYIFAAYASLRTFQASAMGYVGALNIRSDDADKGSTPADAPTMKEMDEFTISPSNSQVNDLWIGYYPVITKCNIILHEAEIDSTNTPEAVKIKAQAEARFLRGYSYFMLVRLFGRVPIVDTVLGNVSESNIPQSSVAEVYAFIERDLQFAAAHLPLTWPGQFTGRVTSGAANGMLAKVYLYEKKWQQAMTTAGIVINSGVYDLETPYDQIFTEAGENSSGSIFEIQCYADANNKTAYGSQYGQIQGVRGSGWANLGWGLNSPSESLDTAYEAGDPRRASTILYCPSKEPTRYGEVFPQEPNPRYNMKVYTNPQKRSEVGEKAGYWVNIRVLRYADVLLMYAEAANELGETDEALEKLEWVRARARNGNNDILPQITERNQDKLRRIIQHERRIELAMEGERFFDLVRWGMADSVLHAAGKTNYTKGRDELLPIPQQQIDLSKGKGKLEQNPGF